MADRANLRDFLSTKLEGNPKDKDESGEIPESSDRLSSVHYAVHCNSIHF